ncbi:hypothetical protein A2U01_0098618, partial [Trifolium medium]|nr:hypothetical protein [Trifolium medium]
VPFCSVPEFIITDYIISYRGTI